MPRVKDPSAPKVTQANRARALLSERGMLRLSEFAEAHIAEETVARLVRQGEVIRLSRGLYQLADAEIETAHTLVEAAKIVPKGVICLLSALQFHGLTTQLPSQVWMAIGRNAWRPSRSYPPLRLMYYGEHALMAGIETHHIEGVDVHIYSAAKTVIDCFRYRNKIGIDLAIEALRDCLRKRLSTGNELWMLAKDQRILSVMNPYLESMTYHGA